MKSWKDITIGQYIDLLPSVMKNKSVFEATYHKLKVLCDLSEEQSMKLTVEEAENLLLKYSFINDLPNTKPVKTFKLNGKRYKVEIDIRKHKADNYMFVMNRLGDLNRDPEAIEKNLHLIMATACHPVKRKFYHKGKFFQLVPIENDLIETAQTFYDHMPISIAYPISIFFCEVSKTLTPYIENSLTQTTKKLENELNQIKEDLKKPTDGT